MDLFIEKRAVGRQVKYRIKKFDIVLRYSYGCRRPRPTPARCENTSGLPGVEGGGLQIPGKTAQLPPPVSRLFGPPARPLGLTYPLGYLSLYWLGEGCGREPNHDRLPKRHNLPACVQPAERGCHDYPIRVHRRLHRGHPGNHLRRLSCVPSKVRRLPSPRPLRFSQVRI